MEQTPSNTLKWLRERGRNAGYNRPVFVKMTNFPAGFCSFFLLLSCKEEDKVIVYLFICSEIEKKASEAAIQGTTALCRLLVDFLLHK